MRFFILALSLLFAGFTWAQNNEGYWDNIRATNETIFLEAGKRKAIKTADFPTGTTEVVYRISLLDDNQKISSSLVSVLKAIPDPSGVSQGTAGAVFLVSTISGDDKCQYYVFTNESDALQFEKSGTVKNACVSQEEPINKAAKLLNESSKCMASGPNNLWFGFESDNWVMKQKIVLEVVPWVNNQMRSGWSAQTKKELLKTIEKSNIAQKVTNKELFMGTFLRAFTSKYTFTDYQKMLPSEKAKALDELTKESLVQSGQLSGYLEQLRKEVLQYNEKNQTLLAITTLQNEVVASNLATDAEYGLLGYLYLISKQYIKAEEAYHKAISLNKSELNHQLQLAHVYLFSNQLSKAKAIHKKYSNNNLTNGISWVAQTQADFKQFEKKGFDTDDFKKVLRLFK